jgi:GNAT superfamily N-acetyltransferase
MHPACVRVSLLPRLTIPTPRGTLTVRPESEAGADADFLLRLFAEVRVPEMTRMGVDPSLQRTLLELQFRSMNAQYAENFPHARFEIVESDGERIGRIVTDVTVTRVTYVDIAVLPAWQRSGIATALMLALLEEPGRLGVPARVQVAVTNAASLRLCARVGFVPIAQMPPTSLLEWRSRSVSL